MIIRQIDARGKTCPLPVIEAKKALEAAEEGTRIEVLVDNEIAVQNLKKMAVQKKYPAVSSKVREGCYLVEITKTGEAKETKVSGEANSDETSVRKEEPENCGCSEQEGDLVIVISSDEMGKGDPALGKVLMKGFVYALTEQQRRPDTVILYNSGARLSCQGSDSLEDLRTLQEQGTEILTCGTCLNHYGLTDALGVGSVTNMYQIAELLTEAQKVVKP